MARAVDGKNFANIAASTSAFQLGGGAYGITCIATFGGGSVDLQILADDGATYVSCSSATKFTTAGYATVSLPRGSFKFVVTTATAVYISAKRIAGE